MKRNVIFVIVFTAVIISLVKLHACSIEQKSDWKTITIDELISISYPDQIEERSDIPFVLLLDNEYKKSLPENTDYEKYKPKSIFLAKNFNENDTTQLQSFPNIVVNVRNIEPVNFSELTDDAKTQILTHIQSTIENEVEKTSYQITNWDELDSHLLDDGIIFRASYTKKNELTDRTVSSTVSYIFSKNREIEITLSTPGETTNKWRNIYDEMIDSVEFN